MSILATGIQTKLVYAKEAVWGVKPLATSGKYLRRVSAELNLARASYESKEIRTDQQTSDLRLGVRSTSGKLEGELSTSTYQDFFAAMLRGPWVTGSTTTALTTISFTANTIVRTAGSWIADGFKVGDVVKATGATDAANNVQHTVTAVTALVLTVDAVKAPLVVAAVGPSITVAVLGKKLVIPQTGQTDDSFTFSKIYDMGTDITEIFSGVKIGDAAIKLGVDAMSTISINLMGSTFESSNTPYFTTPAATTTNGVLSASRGALYVNGVASAYITSIDFNIKSNLQNANVIASTNIADILQGRIAVDGSFEAYFMDNTLLTNMDQEIEQSITVTMQGNGTEQLSFTFPRVKLSEVTKNDAESGGIVQSVKFTALLPLAGSASDFSTVVIQDTTL